MTSKEAFKLAVERVNNACKEEDSNLMKLEELGFAMKNLNEGIELSSRVPNELYTLMGDDGNKVEVDYHAYDPTKPFGGVKPDINKFEVMRYEGEEIVERHRNEYSDKWGV